MKLIQVWKGKNPWILKVLVRNSFRVSFHWRMSNLPNLNSTWRWLSSPAVAAEPPGLRQDLHCWLTPPSSLARLTGSSPFQLSALWQHVFQFPQLPVAGMPPLQCSSPGGLLGSRALWLLTSTWHGARACNHSWARHFGAMAPKTSSFLASLQPTWQIKGQPRAWKQHSQDWVW